MTTFPEPPTFSEDELRACREFNDYVPILFEWYKYVGKIANFLARIQPSSPSVRKIPPLHYAVLIGLLNRCSRLMLANVALSHKDSFGEAVAIIDRCIFESCVKIDWLCRKGTEEGFRQFLADGLKTDLALKKQINDNVQSRVGVQLQIEERMLRSIDNYVHASGLTEEEISAIKKLPDLATMINDLGHHRTIYVTGQKIGSHHVHGTWSSIQFHYLIPDGHGSFTPNQEKIPTHINQYVSVSLFVLGAMNGFVDFIFPEMQDKECINEALNSVREEILTLNRDAIGGDCSPVSD